MFIRYMLDYTIPDKNQNIPQDMKNTGTISVFSWFKSRTNIEMLPQTSDHAEENPSPNKSKKKISLYKIV